MLVSSILGDIRKERKSLWKKKEKTAGKTKKRKKEEGRRTFTSSRKM